MLDCTFNICTLTYNKCSKDMININVHPVADTYNYTFLARCYVVVKVYKVLLSEQYHNDSEGKRCYVVMISCLAKVNKSNPVNGSHHSTIHAYVCMCVCVCVCVHVHHPHGMAFHETFATITILGRLQ